MPRRWMAEQRAIWEARTDRMAAFVEKRCTRRSRRATRPPPDAELAGPRHLPPRCARRGRALWKAWTDPALLKEWWCPKPWTTEVRAFDLRPGGAFHTFMRGPDGGTSDNPGSFLEVVPQARIVFTSMLLGGWRPATPWLRLHGRSSRWPTKARARATSPPSCTRTRPSRDRHEEMGFFDGWNTCIDQLEAFAREHPAT